MAHWEQGRTAEGQGGGKRGKRKASRQDGPGLA